MKYLTIEYIKEHSRIDFDCEDRLIDAYGSAAEETVLQLLSRSLDDLKQAYGGVVPMPVINATAELAENFIRHRGPVEQVGLSPVPYGFDIQLKSYMAL